MSLPKNRPLTELDIIEHSKDIPCFRGVFMRDNLPFKPFKKECAVINLDSSDGPGTHWVAYYKKNNYVYYFDSFGNLRPPQELIAYLGSASIIFYNYVKYQHYDTVICGHLCIQFLHDIENKIENII